MGVDGDYNIRYGYVMRSRTTVPIKLSTRDDRAHVHINLTRSEADAVTAAAHGLPVATWCRWAVLRMAENATRPEGASPPDGTGS